VVAEEVRNLAQKSAEAVKNTTDLIAREQRRISDGVDISNKVSSILAEINGSVDNVGTVIAEVSTASQEQSRGIEQVNKAVVEMEKTTQNFSVTAEKSAMSVEGLSAQTQELNEMVEELSRFVGLAERQANQEITAPVEYSKSQAYLRRRSDFNHR
jgi:Methyl-accepting chemotaxis protein